MKTKGIALAVLDGAWLGDARQMIKPSGMSEIIRHKRCESLSSKCNRFACWPSDISGNIELTDIMVRELDKLP